MATALIAIFGVVIGAVLQYFFTRQTERAKHYQDLRSQAYVDFIRATAGLAISQGRGKKDKEIDATILMVDAKARISIYGSRRVVDRMAQFFDAYNSLDSPEAIKSFIEIIQYMRAETSSEIEMVGTKEIGQLLF